METYYLFLVALLGVLAIFDLIVGVSNDAVNFLNSAIGSKVAPMRNIMIVATVGILLGALFSGGMMEVARKGIFHPGAFHFAEIMVIFISVMLADIILLDLFNTYGMPTSTTVSIVFEILGAAVAVGLISILGQNASISTIVDYINVESAITIITSIFLSVAIAFITGVVVMYISRLLFSFKNTQNETWITRIWASIAMMSMTYFLLVKGLKNAAFVPKAFSAFVKDHTDQALLGLFVLWLFVFSIASLAKRFNILRFVVLFGTFALAMAFAGNDLVNFIGVPMAGYESFKAWSTSGVDPNDFPMDILAAKVKANTVFLVLAGITMAATLWLSKKARSVTDTEVNLGRQDAGYERFQPSVVSRTLVRGIYKMSNMLSGVMPASWGQAIESRFAPDEATAAIPVNDRPAFDLIRASVNLAAASTLIAIATGMKLPLSTTFVSFMVAMGSSLADRAWGRDSAVYRVAGVINVIGGWLFTAFAAFSMAALFAVIISTFGPFAVLALTLTAAFLIYRTFAIHKKEEAKKERRLKAAEKKEKMNRENFVAPATAKIGNTVRNIRSITNGTINGAIREDRRLLKKTKSALNDLRDENEELRHELHRLLQNLDENNSAVGHSYIRIFNIERDLLVAARDLMRNSNRHVNNLHSPINPEQVEWLEKMRDGMNKLFDVINQHLEDKDFTNIDDVLHLKKVIMRDVDKALFKQMEGIQAGSYDAMNSRLMLGLLSDAKDVTAISARFAKLLNRTETDDDLDWEW